MSLMDEFKKIIHPYDDEDDDYEEDVGRDSLGRRMERC